MTCDGQATLLTAPAWARLGLAVRDERMRERAAAILAIAILERQEHPTPRDNRDQLALPL